MSKLAPGVHRVRVTALGAKTIYPLSGMQVDVPLEAPVVPEVEREFRR